MSVKVFAAISQTRVASGLCLVLLVGISVMVGRAITQRRTTAVSPEPRYPAPRLRPANKGKSLKRNLLLQPEAAKMMMRVGNRFDGFSEGVSVLSGTLERSGKSESIQITRRQSEAKEQVEIATSGAALTWNDLAGFQQQEGVSDTTREAMARVISDSVDRFVLSQLSGAAYTVVSRNVRADRTGGSENYDGPLWTVVRVDESRAGQGQRKWRLYYIDARTGLLDKVQADEAGKRYEAHFSQWTEREGEWFPLHTRWTCDGQPLMTLSLTSTSVSLK